jgi:hypothetical protein
MWKYQNWFINRIDIATECLLPRVISRCNSQITHFQRTDLWQAVIGYVITDLSLRSINIQTNELCRVSSVSTVNTLRDKRQWFDSRLVQQICLPSQMTRPALGSQELPGYSSAGSKATGTWRWLPPYTAEVRNMWSHTSIPPTSCRG